MLRHSLRITLLLSLLVFLVWPAAGGKAHAKDREILNVSAAISLKEALAAVKESYAKKEPGIEPTFNLGSSGQLQKQIEEGAPVDIFISAGKQQMDELSRKGLIIPETRFNLLGNELVLVVAKEKQGRIKSFADLAGKGVTFTIGQPETVPAGKYGKEVLVSLKLWDSLAKNMVFAKDVRQVLAYVDSGNVDAGLVYRSDAAALKGAVVAAVAPKGSHAPIVYPVAIVKGSKNVEAAKRFLAFLRTREAAGIFARYRFVPLAAR